MKIPPNLIENWISKHFEYKKRRGKNGEELVLANPFYHNNKYKFNISLSKAVAHDWRGDEWAGPINPNTGKRNCSFINFVIRYKKCSYAEAIKEIFGQSANIYIRKKNDDKPIEHIKLPDGSRKFDNFKSVTQKTLLQWLKSRGYDEDLILRDELHYLGTTVIWPYKEFGELVYWQSRSLTNKIYLYPGTVIVNDQEVGKSDFLYGFDNIKSKSYIIIVESIFNKVTIGDQAVATGGAEISDKQISKLRFFDPEYIILAPDNDKAGILSIISNNEKLKGFNVYYSLPDKNGYDWNDYVVKDKMKLCDVQDILVSNIRKLTITELVNLRKSIR